MLSRGRVVHSPTAAARDRRRYMVYSATTFKYVFDYKLDDVYFCTADIGWVRRGPEAGTDLRYCQPSKRVRQRWLTERSRSQSRPKTIANPTADAPKF